VADDDEVAQASADALAWCKRFRKLAKRVRGLPAATSETASDQPERTAVLEGLFDILGEVDVWSAAIGESVCVCAIMVYEAKDDEACVVLTHLADEELRRMTDAVGQPQDDEEGDSDSG
jgi:hypothetical protein